MLSWGGVQAASGKEGAARHLMRWEGGQAGRQAGRPATCTKRVDVQLDGVLCPVLPQPCCAD
jgi:hypothetical protein